jgi:hypothetical protein
MSHGCMQGQLNPIDAEKANTVMIALCEECLDPPVCGGQLGLMADRAVEENIGGSNQVVMDIGVPSVC